MLYDLKLAKELCDELRLQAALQDHTLEIDLGDDAILVLQNDERAQDCLIGFFGTGWHGHGDLMFANRSGGYAELDYLNILTSLKEGHVLVCERWIGDRLVDRWLTHGRYADALVDELGYLEEGE